MIEMREIPPIKCSGETSVALRFDYNPDIIGIVKSCDGSVWHKKEALWEVPANCLSFLLDSLTFRDDIELTLLPYGREKEHAVPSLEYKTKPFPHQLEAIEYGLNHDSWLLLDSPGLGKMEPVNADIPTADGFKKMGELRVGDRVFSSDGNLCAVKDIFEHNGKDIYRVTFSDGSSAECGIDHLWIVRDRNMVRRNQGWKVMSLGQMMEMGLQYHDLAGNRGKSGRGLLNKFEIPMVSPVNYAEKDYLIHPYVLGMCLGDGTMCNGSILISIPDKDRESAGLIASLLDDEMTLVEDRSTNCPRYRIKHKTHAPRNKYLSEMRRLGIVVRGDEKFIPERYKLGSFEQRLELLRGLMDSDGSIRPRNRLRYDTVSERLADDFCELVNSLGGTAKKHAHDRTKEGKRVEYYVIFRLRFNPFHLKRKAEMYRPSPKYRCSRYIKSAELIGKSDARCILVDSADHSYVTGRDYVVTHNTMTMINLAEELRAQRGVEHCLIICGIATLRANWEKEIKSHSNLPYVTIGKRVNSKGNVTWATVKERAEQLKGKIDEFFVILNVESLRDDSILDAILNSENRFDMVVADEVHKMKSSNSAQGHNLLRVGAKYRIGLSGTLILNNALDCFVPLKWVGAEHATLTNFKGMYCEFGGFGGHQVVGFKNMDVLKGELESCSLRRTKDLMTLPPKTLIDEFVEMSPEHAKFYEDVKEGVKEECEKIDLKASNLLALTTRLRQATTCPSVLTTKGIRSCKIDRASELVDDITSHGDKVVVMSTFKEPIYQLADILKEYHPLLGTGDMKDDEVSRNIDAFQNDDEHKVILCTMSKMGTGITLNRARYMILLDEPWTYALYEQVTDRIHRINNTQPVFVYNLICERTIDERVAKIINRKKAISDFIVDDKPSEELRSIITDL